MFSVQKNTIFRKSTLVRLLYRLYDVDSGRITVNGVDIRDATLSSLRQNVAIVPQVYFPLLQKCFLGMCSLPRFHLLQLSVWRH